MILLFFVVFLAGVKHFVTTMCGSLLYQVYILWENLDGENRGENFEKNFSFQARIVCVCEVNEEYEKSEKSEKNEENEENEEICLANKYSLDFCQLIQ